MPPVATEMVSISWLCAGAGASPTVASNSNELNRMWPLLFLNFHPAYHGNRPVCSAGRSLRRQVTRSFYWRLPLVVPQPTLLPFHHRSDGILRKGNLEARFPLGGGLF